MNDLLVTEHRDLIEDLVAKHVDACVEFVKSKDDINGKLGQSLWGSATEKPLIQFPEQITGQEIEDSLMGLAVRGQVTENPQLVRHAGEINSPLEYLKHLVLHEVAHIKNDWHQDRETDCDLWVYDQMHTREESKNRT